MGKNSWEFYRNKRKATKLSYDADVPRFIGIRPSLKYLIKHWPKGFLVSKTSKRWQKTGRSIALVKRLPELVAALNNDETWLTGKKANQSSLKYKRPVGFGEKGLPSNVNVCTTSLANGKVGKRGPPTRTGP